jgi:general stress protein 26
MNDVIRQQAVEEFSRHFLCVLSTVTEDAKPQSAIVGYAASENLQLLIGTSNKTRKYANLQHNAQVSVVVGDTVAEIQYEGTARLLERSEAESLVGTQFKALPGTAKYINDPDQAWFLINPTWLRLTVHGTPNRVEEIGEFA